MRKPRASYSIYGDEVQGMKITVPSIVGAKPGDRYSFEYCDETKTVTLPKGAVVYVPKVRK